MKPDELDYGAHRNCAWCGKLHSQKRMLQKDDKFFCGIQHYLLYLNINQTEKTDDSTSDSAAVIPFRGNGTKPDT